MSLLSRQEVLDKYSILKSEMKKRGLRVISNNPLDKAIFKAAMVGIDVPGLGDVVEIPDYVSIGEPFAKSAKEAGDVEIVIRDDEANRDENLEQELSYLVRKATNKKCHFVYDQKGPQGDFVPLFDRVLKVKAETKRVKKFEISKPETTEDYHRIPVSDCKITATIDISEKDGIKALYCGKEKKIATYLFDVDNFTMKEAKAWVKEHSKEKVAKSVDEVSNLPVDDRPDKIDFEKFVPIFDISKKEDEHIVCGIVYEPDTEDTQGDQASEAEIRKAAYKYMEHVQKFKVMHKGAHKKAIRVLESYIAPVDFELNGNSVKKGSWVLTARVLDEDIWKQIKKGEITGFSMAGRAAKA